MEVVIRPELQFATLLDLNVNDVSEVSVVRQDHVEDRPHRVWGERQDHEVLLGVRRASSKCRRFLGRGIQTRRKRTAAQIAFERNVRIARQVSHHSYKQPGMLCRSLRLASGARRAVPAMVGNPCVLDRRPRIQPACRRRAMLACRDCPVQRGPACGGAGPPRRVACTGRAEPGSACRAWPAPRGRRGGSLASHADRGRRYEKPHAPKSTPSHGTADTPAASVKISWHPAGSLPRRAAVRGLARSVSR